MRVRLAGIKVMSIFGKRCPSIRTKVLRFLIDMLNDEIDEVRIGALKGIARFNQVQTLKENEVETVLFNLKEDNFTLREGIYQFFSQTRIQDIGLFMTLIEGLLDNLKRFPSQDQRLIFTLMNLLGKSHKHLITENYCQIFGIDKLYLPQSPPLEDMQYVAKFILVASAAKALKPG
mmetsp:Transcript_23016/g.35590  ORF Transcript_23016/g.35590 Transcript_23016/m.35590 type:complete len:176 (+) Transcript_23016:1315-1842(+)